MAVLPSRTGWNHIIGVGFLGGIGFTVSLFITELAYAGNDTVIDQSKIAVLVASILASAMGSAFILKAKAPIEPEVNGDLGPITYEELEATSPESLIATARDQHVAG